MFNRSIPMREHLIPPERERRPTQPLATLNPNTTSPKPAGAACIDGSACFSANGPPTPKDRRAIHLVVDIPLGVNTPSSMESKMRRLSLIAAIVADLSLLAPAVAVAGPNDCYSCVGNTCAPSGPQGGTARCRDGSYSFSQHPTATCSGRHGGVSQWLTG